MKTETQSQGRIIENNPSVGEKLLWWVSAQGLKASLFLIRIFPEHLLLKLGEWFGSLGYLFLAHRKKTAQENIQRVFGSNISEAESKSLTKATFKHISQDMIEIGRSFVSPQYENFLTKYISVQGIEHLDKALKKGNGVIAVSAHVGNFPIISAKMAALGYPFSLIAKDPKNIYLIDIFKQWRDLLGIGFIPYKPRHLCASESLKVLRKNGIIFLLIDQNPRKRYGIKVEFFGYHVPTYGGPVVLAKRTRAAIIPMFIHRNKNNTETITILPEISLKHSKDRDQEIVDNLRTINKLCEDWIRKYPEQWWWLHRRFRRAGKIPIQENAGGSSSF